MSARMTVPLSDPKAGYLAHREAIDAGLRRVLESGWYILGKEVEAFETAFASYLGVGHVIGVGSGTDALHLALRTLGIGPGDAVLTVAHTAVATVAAVELAGAEPVLVDVDPTTFTMDPTHLEATLQNLGRGGVRAKAILPVHLYGHPADLNAIGDIAQRYGLAVLEDCAQCHGARFRGQRTGSFGQLAAFSFYPTKNLGALGDGGAVATDDADLATRARLLREYGWRERYISDLKGMNTRLDVLQAAILSARLPHLDAENARRQRIAASYSQALARTGLIGPVSRGEVDTVCHLYVVRSRKRDALANYLKERGIGRGVHYPVPVHLQPAYRNKVLLGPSGLPQTERAAREVLSLPMYPQLTDEHIAYVAEHLAAWREE